MNLEQWIHPKYTIQFPVISEIGLNMEATGVVNRAWGLSEGAYALMPPVNPVVLKRKFIPLAEQAEEAALDAFDNLDNEASYLAQIPVEQIYPTVIMRVAIADSEVAFSITLNTRRSSPLVYNRFIAFLATDEVELYQDERSGTRY
jgi:hypothetical protein